VSVEKVHHAHDAKRYASYRNGVTAIMGALALYLDFIDLFPMLMPPRGTRYFA
jgi:FtsH-binding integral membrane protein